MNIFLPKKQHISEYRFYSGPQNYVIRSFNKSTLQLILFEEDAGREGWLEQAEILEKLGVAAALEASQGGEEQVE